MWSKLGQFTGQDPVPAASLEIFQGQVVLSTLKIAIVDMF